MRRFFIFVMLNPFGLLTKVYYLPSELLQVTEMFRIIGHLSLPLTSAQPQLFSHHEAVNMGIFPQQVLQYDGNIIR